MKVTTTAEHVTHAVINNGETLAFGVSDDPMFFQMLSSTLYTRQTEACVRETLCNAWDAHISEGKEGVAVQVTFDDHYMTIRDFGPGIPHDKIRPIYLVYGKSTKANQSNQTGGFGLGCKAPFAYCEHFEVRSFHKGVCTIYNMSKSSIEHEGRPTAVVVATLPTQETGLQVRIPISTTGNGLIWNRRDLIRLVQNLTYLGGMKVTLKIDDKDPEELPTLNLDPTPGSFCVSNDAASRLTVSSDHILVRYGSVVYPVHQTDEIRDEWNDVKTILESVTGNAYSGCVVFQAGPDSICIPPSRESLSVSDLTTKTLKELFAGFTKGFDDAFNAKCRDVIIGKFQEILQDPKNSGHSLFSMKQEHYLGRALGQSSNNNIATDITDTDSLLKAAVARRIPSKSGYRELVVKSKLDSIVLKGLVPKADVDNIYAVSGDNLNGSGRSYLYDTYLDPLVGKMEKETELTDKNLFYVGANPYGGRQNILHPMSERNDRIHVSFNSVVKFARKIVVLTHTKKFYLDEDFKTKTPLLSIDLTYTDLLLYLVPQTKNRAQVVGDAARKFFAAEGYQVIDLTVEYMADKQAAQAARRALNQKERAARLASGDKPVSKRKTGFLGVATFMPKADDVYAVFNRTVTDEVRIAKPKWYAAKPTFTNTGCSGGRPLCTIQAGLSGTASALLVRLFGSTGAFYTTFKQLGEMQKAGAVSLDDYVAQQCIKYLTQNIEHLRGLRALDISAISRTDHVEKLLKGSSLTHFGLVNWVDLIIGSPALAKYYGLILNVRTTKLDQQMSEILDLINYGAFTIKEEDKQTIAELRQRVGVLKIHPNLPGLINLLVNNKVIPFVRRDEIENKLSNLKSNSKEYKQLVASVIRMINSL